MSDGIGNIKSSKLKSLQNTDRTENDKEDYTAACTKIYKDFQEQGKDIPFPSLFSFKK